MNRSEFATILTFGFFAGVFAMAIWHPFASIPVAWLAMAACYAWIYRKA